MLLQPAHLAGTRIVHVTHTTLVVEALCGEAVDLHGEPDLPVICGDCLELARAARADISLWIAEVEIQTGLLLAA
jgi:hypothetical protein